MRAGTRFRQGTLLVRIFDEEARNNLRASKSRFLNAIAGILPDLKIDYPGSYRKYEDFFNQTRINEPLPPLPEPGSEAETLEESMEIPRNALFETDHVFTVEDGKLKKNRIDILKVNETTVIFSGLPEGADLVVEPLVNAKEGYHAEILDQP